MPRKETNPHSHRARRSKHRSEQKDNRSDKIISNYEQAPSKRTSKTNYGRKRVRFEDEYREKRLNGGGQTLRTQSFNGSKPSISDPSSNRETQGRAFSFEYSNSAKQSQRRRSYHQKALKTAEEAQSPNNTIADFKFHENLTKTNLNEGIISKSDWIRYLKHRNELASKYVHRKLIGTGNFSQVHEVFNKRKKQSFALKDIPKKGVKGKEEYIENEVELLFRCRHPNIIQLVAAYETKDSYLMLMEYLEYGDLFEYIKSNGSLPEALAAGIVNDVASALQYLHQFEIVHRDVKPENLLLTSTFQAKLCDFGLACRVMGPLYRVCGTPTYVAPEILAEIGAQSTVRRMLTLDCLRRATAYHLLRDQWVLQKQRQ